MKSGNKIKIETVKNLRDFLTKLIRKSKCGDEKIKFFLKSEDNTNWKHTNWKQLKLVCTCRDGILKETLLDFMIC
jgi:hypothetical protein